MKTRNILFLSLLIMTMFATEVSAQGWLNKALKKADELTKKVDDGLTKIDDTARGIVEHEITNPGYTEASVKCTNPKLNIQLGSCIRRGKLTVLSFTIINDGSDLTISHLGRSTMPKGQTNTSIFDSEGNQYKWKDLTFGNEGYNGTDWLAPVTFPEGLKMKCYVAIENVSRAATHLQRVTIGALDFHLQFNKVRIYTFEESLALLNPLEIAKKENPAVSNITVKGMTVKAVTLTDKYTRVDCTWKNDQFSPQGTIYMSNPDQCRIEMNGEEYFMKDYNGMGAARGDVWIDYGKSINFTYIFEPLPADTKSFNLLNDEIEFSGISMEENAPAETVATRPTFTLNKGGVDCLKLGMLFSAIPAQRAGLYDRFEKKIIEDDMDGDYTVYNFYLGKEKVATLPQYDNKVSSIVVCSSAVSTADGVYPGMPIKELLLKKGVKGEYNDGLRLSLNGYLIDFDGLTDLGYKAFNDAYAKGTDVKLSAACFTNDAKVVAITVY